LKTPKYSAHSEDDTKLIYNNKSVKKLFIDEEKIDPNYESVKYAIDKNKIIRK